MSTTRNSADSSENDLKVRPTGKVTICQHITFDRDQATPNGFSGEIAVRPSLREVSIADTRTNLAMTQGGSDVVMAMNLFGFTPSCLMVI
ncbi:hypothetical protein GCM10011609_87500 [Lentzea pudingi]|uniref:FXSXX-COOH protein n=2 Tax=Lentzea pudingi TaxID=1789439 RepID=A0ABQ2IWY9_9PSEU|nr:hypothetical protein GCM10011609_87500 [Lentzea pudingi]